mmetsp:Transcript_7890/g.14309  ORF Transcript_7890/g.14309 Transcript_7890/m.14309 type:complete len:483 (-) Transcript_7890:1112-2560(-)
MMNRLTLGMLRNVNSRHFYRDIPLNPSGGTIKLQKLLINTSNVSTSRRFFNVSRAQNYQRFPSMDRLHTTHIILSSDQIWITTRSLCTNNKESSIQDMKTPENTENNSFEDDQEQFRVKSEEVPSHASAFGKMIEKMSISEMYKVENELEISVELFLRDIKSAYFNTDDSEESDEMQTLIKRGRDLIQMNEAMFGYWQKQSDPDRSERNLEQVLELTKALLGAESEEYANRLHTLGHFNLDPSENKLEKAIEYLTPALNIYMRTDNHPMVLNVKNELALAYGYLNQFEKSISMLKMLREHVDKNNAEVAYQQGISISDNIRRVCFRNGIVEDARKAVRDELFAIENNYSRYSMKYTDALMFFVTAASSQNDYEECVNLSRIAFEVSQCFGDDSLPHSLAVMSLREHLLKVEGGLEEAESLTEKAKIASDIIDEHVKSMAEFDKMMLEQKQKEMDELKNPSASENSSSSSKNESSSANLSKIE